VFRRWVEIIGLVGAVAAPVGVVGVVTLGPGSGLFGWCVAMVFGGMVLYPLSQVILKPDGDLVPELVCPHCQTKGKVYRDLTIEKSGIDGTKAAGAILTGGASLWFIGLSEKFQAAKLTCKNCGSEWTVRR
jgi:hypothetical protein